MDKVVNIKKIFLESSEIVISNVIQSLAYKDYTVNTDFNCKSEFEQVMHDENLSYVVSLNFNIYTRIENEPLYNLSLVQSGLFALKGYEPEEIEQILAVECPEIILPYARQNASFITTQTGLAPVMIQNINFQELYEEQKNIEQS